MKESHVLFGKCCGKIILAVCVFCVLLPSCTKKLSPQQIETERLNAVEQAEKTAVSEFVSSLSDAVKISQLFLVNIEGNEKYHAVEKTGSLYGKNGEGEPLVPGGVLLFSYNISKDPLETYDYIKSIRDFYIQNKNIPPYVSVDQEGGYVNRLRGLTSLLWSQKKVTESFSEEEAFRLYSSQARQMKNLGFHLNLAPVVEVETEQNADFLDTRSFGNIDAVISYGTQAVNAYEQNGIAVVLKHFPGNSSVDPHVGLPKIFFEESDRENYFKPFEVLLPYSSAVLMSHAIMKPKNVEEPDLSNSAGEKKSDEKYSMPACFSEYWISQRIRKDFAFKGLVFSDDIFMGALAKNGYPPEVAAVNAIRAGVDVIMLSEKKFGPVAKILLEKTREDKKFEEELLRSVTNVILYKIKAGILVMEQNGENEISIGGQTVKIPSYVVKTNPNYEDFDLSRFDEDYRAGMSLYDK